MWRGHVRCGARGARHQLANAGRRLLPGATGALPLPPSVRLLQLTPPSCSPSAHLQAAAQYIEEHNLQKVVEDAINATIKAKPAEPFSYMVGAGGRTSDS